MDQALGSTEGKTRKKLSCNTLQEEHPLPTDP